MSLKAYNIELQGSTIRYLELLCSQYNLTSNELVFHGLRLMELDLAEFEARRIATCRSDSHETK